MAIFSLAPTFATAGTAIIGLFLAFLLEILHKAYVTPLHKIPGPWYTKFTHLVLKYHVITGNRMHYVHSLHEKYGPIVLIAPAEVSCSSLPSFQTIHRISKPFLKSSWYQKFVPKPANLFTMIDPKEHAGRRKLFANAFSKSSLKTNWESEVRKKVEMAVEKIKKNALEGEVDILKFWTFMSTDVVGHLCFGESFQALEKEQSSQYIKDLQHAGQVAFIRAEFPNLFRIGELFKFSFLETPNERILGYGSIAVQNARSNIQSGASNIFQKVLAEGKTENGEGLLTDQDIQKQAAGFIIAGTDTTALSLTYLVYNILRNPGLQKQLEDEVDKLPENFESKDVEELELLNATIDEGLRLWTPAPGSLPRIVPKEGAQLDGYYIPGDIAISTQAYTIHRDPEIFPEPESFKPERWLSSKSDDMKTAHHPFGAGTRTCVGIHLARMEMWLALALFFRKCKGARVASSQNEEGMEMRNFFLIEPKGKKCMISMREGY